MDAEQQLRSLYAAFNARDVDRMLGEMGDDVDWPNAWEGGRLHGRQSVRDYWTRQWSQIDPSLEVIQITARPDGRVVVEVRQLVRSVGGETLSDGRVRHLYTLRYGLVIRMDVREQDEPD